MKFRYVLSRNTVTIPSVPLQYSKNIYVLKCFDSVSEQQSFVATMT